MATGLATVSALLLALGLDLAFGDPPNRWHPVAWLGRVVAWGQRALARGSRPLLLLNGAVLALGVTMLAAGAGWIVSTVAGQAGALGFLVEGVALKCVLSLRALADGAQAVAQALSRGALSEARATVGFHLVSRPTAALDEAHVVSATIESVAENLTDGFVAPACFFLAFGLPGAFAYRAVNTADAMIGYREGVLEHFGKTAARFDDLLNLVPARLAGGALVLGAVLAGGDARGALRIMRRDRRRTASPNAGWTMAAMAGALRVVLEKPDAYRLGDGALPSRHDIGRSLKVIAAGAAVVMAVAVAAAFLWG